MTPPPESSIQPMLDRLCSAMDQLGLTRAIDHDALLHPDPNSSSPLKKGYLVSENGLNLTAAGQFEFNPEGLIVDHVLGSLGLVTVVTKPDSDEQICELVEREKLHLKRIKLLLDRQLQQAVFLRQLALEESERKRPYFVEQVFLVPSDAKSLVFRALEEVFREWSQDSTYLRYVGVHVIVDHDNPNEQQHLQYLQSVRCALCWLLTSTSAWYAHSLDESDQARSRKSPEAATEPAEARQEEEASQQHAFTSISLKDFRLRGSRTWELDRRKQLHIVHGHNGSGKTSVVEALELVLTGRIERFESIANADYHRILCNSAVQALTIKGAETPYPEIKIRWTRVGDLQSARPNIEAEWKVVPHGIESLNASPTRFKGMTIAAPASFRLNQAFSDRLIQSDDTERANAFLRAFLPELHIPLQAYTQAHGQLVDALNNLPLQVRQLLEDRRQSAEPATVNISRSRLPDLNDRTQVFNFFDKAFKLTDMEQQFVATNTWPKAQSRQSRTSVATYLERYDRLRIQAMVDTKLQFKQCNELLDYFQQLNDWAAAKTPTSRASLHHYARQLNAWLESCVLCDLAKKELDLVSTILHAQADSQNALNDLALFKLIVKNFKSTSKFAESQIEQLQSRLDQFNADRERQLTELMTLVIADHNAGNDAPRTEAPELPHSLDEVIDTWFAGDDNNKPSRILRLALKEQEVTKLDTHAGVSINVGVAGGCAFWLAFLSSRQQQLDNIIRTNVLEELKLKEQYELLLKVNHALAAYETHSQNIRQEFVNLLCADSPLARALQELMRVMTPARWAYGEIVTESSLNRDKVEIKLQTEDRLPINTRLNTAELNTLSLAIFLLCGVRIDNSLRLLLLDDPFQNMDELTVLTIARGLNRIAELWRQPDSVLSQWCIALFLHSPEDVERIRREIDSAVYLLPWLAPVGTAANTDLTIKAEPHFFDGGFSDLRGLFPAQPLSLVPGNGAHR